MTNQDELWAELEKLADPEEARKVEQARNRSNFAPPFLAVTCDIPDIAPPWMETLDNGRTRRVISIWLENLRDVELADNRTLDSTESYELRVPVPDKAQANGVLFLMSASLRGHMPSAKSIASLKGAKGVRLEEEVHEYSGRGFIVDPINGTQTDRDGNLGYWGERKFETRYYAVKSLGKVANGAPKAEPATLSPALRTAALAFLNGKTEKEFTAGVLKDATVRAASEGSADMSALSTAVISGSLIKQATADGLITIGENGYELREVAVS